MWAIVACTLILTCFVHVDSRDFLRVPGGMPVRIEDYPYMAALWINRNACSGSIIGSRTIISSAHCFNSNETASWVYVFVGSGYLFSNEAVRYNVAEYVKHPHYGEINTTNVATNDIALIFLANKIVFGPRAQKVPLVKSNKWMNAKYHNFEAVGYGKTAKESKLSIDGLQRTTLRYVPHKECAKTRFTELPEIHLTKEMICFIADDGKSTTCSGDSGSSIIWRGQIVGLCSYYRGNQCDVTSYSVYCNVWMMRHWIEKTWQGFRRKYGADNDS